MAAIYRIDGREFHAPSHELEDAIAAAYAIGLRPICMCRASGVEMYTARAGSRFIVKRLPWTGSQHAAACRSYAPPDDVSGSGEVLQSAVVEDPATGLTNLRVNFALSKHPDRSTAFAPRPERQRAASDDRRLSLRSLLHYLWNEADLTLWQPGFAGKRSWAVVRSRLLMTAGTLLLQGRALRPRLFVPEPFSVDERDAIAARQTSFWSRFSVRKSKGQPLMLMVAELKEIMPSDQGYRAVIRHLPDQVFSMDDALFKRMRSRFEPELRLWSDRDRVRVVALCSVEFTRFGTARIEELSLMTTDRHWIPIEDMHEHALMERLVEKGRTFRKRLRFDLSRACSIESAMLLDVGEAGELAFVYRLGDHVPGPNADRRQSLR